MIKDLADRILTLFKQGKGLPREEMCRSNTDLSKIVSIILSECKCSLIDENGNYIRYGSSIDISVVEKIILCLLSDKNKIPKEITEKALAKEGIKGPSISLKYIKKFSYIKQITDIDICPIMANNFNDELGKNNSEIQTKLMDEILKPYVKKLIFTNETLMKRSPIGAFISKSLYKGKSSKQLKEAYLDILQRYLKNPKEEQLRNSVNYIIDDILKNDIFEKELINDSINSTELQMLGKVYTGFNGLVYNMITTALSMLTLKESPNVNLIHIVDIYYTAIGVLTALSTDLLDLNEIEIADVLKVTNRNFNIISNNANIEKSIYRKDSIEKDLYGNKIKFVEPEDIDKTVQTLCLLIKNLIKNRDKISNEEFIREVMRINYRFLRIQPFKFANGRTSRALINMLLQTKGMSAYFEKDIRLKYIQSLSDAHKIIAKNEDKYIFNIVNNPIECILYEDEFLQNKLPILIIKD